MTPSDTSLWAKTLLTTRNIKNSRTAASEDSSTTLSDRSTARGSESSNTTTSTTSIWAKCLVSKSSQSFDHDTSAPSPILPPVQSQYTRCETPQIKNNSFDGSSGHREVINEHNLEDAKDRTSKMPGSSSTDTDVDFTTADTGNISRSSDNVAELDKVKEVLGQEKTILGPMMKPVFGQPTPLGNIHGSFRSFRLPGQQATGSFEKPAIGARTLGGPTFEEVSIKDASKAVAWDFADEPMIKIEAPCINPVRVNREAGILSQAGTTFTPPSASTFNFHTPYTYPSQYSKNNITNPNLSERTAPRSINSLPQLASQTPIKTEKGTEIPKHHFEGDDLLETEPRKETKPKKDVPAVDLKEDELVLESDDRFDKVLKSIEEQIRGTETRLLAKIASTAKDPMEPSDPDTAEGQKLGAILKIKKLAPWTKYYGQLAVGDVVRVVKKRTLKDITVENVRSGQARRIEWEAFYPASSKNKCACRPGTACRCIYEEPKGAAKKQEIKKEEVKKLETKVEKKPEVKKKPEVVAPSTPKLCDPATPEGQKVGAILVLKQDPWVYGMYNMKVSAGECVEVLEHSSNACDVRVRSIRTGLESIVPWRWFFIITV